MRCCAWWRKHKKPRIAGFGGLDQPAIPYQQRLALHGTRRLVPA